MVWNRNNLETFRQVFRSSVTLQNRWFHGRGEEKCRLTKSANKQISGTLSVTTARPPHFCRIMNNFLLFYHGKLIKTLFLHKTSIDWVSNWLVGFSIFNFAVCVTNLKNKAKQNRSLTYVLFYRQLKTSWLVIFRRFAWVVVWVILFDCD